MLSRIQYVSQLAIPSWQRRLLSLTLCHKSTPYMHHNLHGTKCVVTSHKHLQSCKASLLVASERKWIPAMVAGKLSICLSVYIGPSVCRPECVYVGLCLQVPPHMLWAHCSKLATCSQARSSTRGWCPLSPSCSLPQVCPCTNRFCMQ